MIQIKLPEIRCRKMYLKAMQHAPSRFFPLPILQKYWHGLIKVKNEPIKTANVSISQTTSRSIFLGRMGYIAYREELEMVTKANTFTHCPGKKCSGR